MLPGARHRGIGISNTINQYFLKTMVLRKIKELGFHSPILWTYSMNSGSLVGKIGEKLVIYDCVDAMNAYPNANIKYVNKLETDLVKKADLVFVTAQNLLTEKKAINPNTHLVPNGVDYDVFSQAQSDNLSIPDDIANLRKPIIGFVGAVAEWIDIDLLSFLAKENPEWEFVVVGPVRVDVSAAAALSNVHFLGPKPWRTLPSYLSNFAAGLSIFKLDRLSNSVNPLKVYEYLASGIPVVSVAMSEVVKLGSVVYIADDYAQFNQKLRLAVSEDSPSRIAERMRVAESHSWASLLDDAWEKIESTLATAK
jgi:glycosyltransferase involved in cell wall biosynthesis